MNNSNLMLKTQSESASGAVQMAKKNKGFASALLRLLGQLGQKDAVPAGAGWSNHAKATSGATEGGDAQCADAPRHPTQTRRAVGNAALARANCAGLACA
ncbi:hypothetical protein HSX11_28110 [Oxalobacteraceae bacterium]|nr:hypothetical protein [Oxalobacteraceae bacterium]